jgi:hypothetical protein
MSIWGWSSPATYCQPAAAAGFIYCRSQEWALHWPSPTGFVYLEFSWMYAPFVFSSIQSYPPFAIPVLFYLEFMWGGAPPPLWWSVPHFSCFWMPSPIHAHWRRWCYTCLLWQACIFTVCLGECPSPTLVELSTRQPLLQAFLAPGLLGGGCHSCLLPLACYLQFCEVLPLPPQVLGAPRPLCYVSFFSPVTCLLFSLGFFLFSLGGGQSVQVTILICPREYCLQLICSPGGLPSRVGAGVWQHGSPPGFFV